MRGSLKTLEEHRKWLAATLSISWLLSTAYAFWWFQLRTLQPFDPVSPPQSVLFEAGRMTADLAALLAADPARGSAAERPVATVVHFWDPACPCSRFNEAHVRKIVAEYARRGVQFLVVARAGSGLSEALLAARAHRTFGDAVRLVNAPSQAAVGLTPSSPATAILDADGKLAYFGPYSTGAVCTATQGLFAEKVLDQLLQGNHPQLWNTWASGCLCSWSRQV
jgi:hypothetical protein